MTITPECFYDLDRFSELNIFDQKSILDVLDDKDIESPSRNVPIIFLSPDEASKLEIADEAMMQKVKKRITSMRQIHHLAIRKVSKE
jgi:hypothetical protein